MANYEKANGIIALSEDSKPQGPISPFKIN